MTGSVLFTWLQGADFYRSVHAEAVACVPPGKGEAWIDAGCGPGLVCRLASARGYRVTGIDRSDSMIAAARRLARRHAPHVTFKVGDAGRLPAASADVVSAASLLAVLDDRAAGLAHLWEAVRPGGRLLVLEATAQMTPARVRALIARGALGRRTLALRLWATARGGRTVDPAVYGPLAPAAERTASLLDGMVEVRVFRKAA